MVLKKTKPQSSSDETPASPTERSVRLSKARLTVVMVFAVYPLVTALLYVLGPITSDWQIWHRTLILTPVTVASIIFVITPMVNKYLGTHLRPWRKQSD